MVPNRNSQFQFANGLQSANRVVIPPMASQTADENGFVTDATLIHYERLAKAGAGLIFVEYSSIHASGRGEPHQLAADASDKIPGLRALADIIHRSGALAGLQLVHVGGKTTRAIVHDTPMAPSAIQVPVHGWQPDMPRPMTEADIQSWVQWFVQSAHIAAQAGFDFIELHAAHGYGLNQWLSPLTNQRTDIYGGTIRERIRILFDIVSAVKAEVPSLSISVRLPAQDHYIGGLRSDEMIWVVMKLEQLGIDLINVSSGLGGWRRPLDAENSKGEGYLVSDAALLRTHLSIPVIGVGGIESGIFIDQILREEKVDFAAVGRAILKEPEAWGKKNLRS